MEIAPDTFADMIYESTMYKLDQWKYQTETNDIRRRMHDARSSQAPLDFNQLEAEQTAHNHRQIYDHKNATVDPKTWKLNCVDCSNNSLLPKSQTL